MIEAGLTAVLIKVAGIGLTPKHLGKTLGEMKPTLMKLVSRNVFKLTRTHTMLQNSLYGSHVCGEGGEYETLTVDSPMFKSRIILLVRQFILFPILTDFSEEVESVIHSDSDFATVAYLRVKEGRLEAKESHPTSENLAVPQLLEGEHKDVEGVLSRTALEVREWPQLARIETPLLEPKTSRVGDWIAVSNIQIPSLQQQSISLEAEVGQCFEMVEGTYFLLFTTSF
jgi:diphthine-ammonia ligase